MNRYNSLVKIYSKRFLPPLKVNDGIILNNGAIKIDAEHFSDFAQMVYYYKNNIK